LYISSKSSKRVQIWKMSVDCRLLQFTAHKYLGNKIASININYTIWIHFSKSSGHILTCIVICTLQTSDVPSEQWYQWYNIHQARKSNGDLYVRPQGVLAWLCDKCLVWWPTNKSVSWIQDLTSKRIMGWTAAVTADSQTTQLWMTPTTNKQTIYTIVLRSCNRMTWTWIGSSHGLFCMSSYVMWFGFGLTAIM
jgi:hypothetical protein